MDEQARNSLVSVVRKYGTDQDVEFLNCMLIIARAKELAAPSPSPREVEAVALLERIGKCLHSGNMPLIGDDIHREIITFLAQPSYPLDNAQPSITANNANQPDKPSGE
jgi:hypothetical protein